MSAEACVRWRNFISVAQDLSFFGTMNNAIEVNLGSMLLQGANPIDMDVINEKNFQGAFRLNYAVTVPPKFGRLEPGSYGTGWRYYPNKDYVGVDEFYYVLNNGTQNSAEAKITVQVDPGLSGSITVFKARGKPYWKFLGTHTIPGPTSPPDPLPPDYKNPRTFGPYDMIVYSFIEKRPMRTYFVGEPYIYQSYNVIQSSLIAFQANVYLPYVTDLKAGTDWRKYEWPDPQLSGYLPHTATPYIQPAGPFPITLKIDFYAKPILNHLDYFVGWHTHDIAEIEIVQDKGEDWWYNGQVITIEPDEPDYPNYPWYP